MSRLLVIYLYLSTIVLSNGTELQTDSSDSTELESELSGELDRLNQRESIEIYDNVISLELIPVTDEETKQIEEEQDPLMRRIDRFLSSRKIHIKLPNDGSAADFLGRALGETNIDFELRKITHGASEARTKLKKILLPLLLALKLKALIVLPIVITVIGLIGIKGLGTGLLALLLSGAVALKALLTPPAAPARISYGIIKPHELHHDQWHRSQEEVNQPYKAWSPDYPIDQYPYPEVP